ncbi:thioester-containing protein 1 allele S1-like [Sitodiplosis mosellana]|uniref:thioester-containing protein 1 allele S1-like n=1 Tax=Sitodiplosis mosellana TaxID=263140 RepID=UPI002443C4D5|nr:thioester-containing protein 1 allele S1-like [Sitodiplosis mosellana]
MQRISPLIVSIGVLSVLIGCVSCAGFYTIVAPENIRSHLDYHVSLTLHEHTEPATFRLSIQDGLKYKNEKEITVNSNKTELVTLRIGDLDSSKGYKFVAEGISSFIFRNESTLKVELKNVSIFIQTDKAIYKPGESIKFRVLVLDNELKPAALTPESLLSIHITDPEKNRIKQWLKVTPKRGVFTSEIQLSELPLLGYWKIIAQVGEEINTKDVQVAKYVLPKFDVSIDSPNDYWAGDGKVRAIIRSKYTYGKLVRGEAIISLTPRRHYGFWYNREKSDSILKTIPIDGKGTVEFDSFILAFSEDTDRHMFELKATVVEELTGRNQTASKTITIHKNRYKFNTMGLSRVFTPGLPVTFSLGVSHHDNSPVLLNEETKWIQIGKIANRHRTDEDGVYYKFELNKNGTADIRVPTMRNETHFDLQVKYLDEEKRLGYFYPRTTDEPSELEAKVISKRPTLNQNVLVEVQSKRLLQNFTYQVIGRGKLIYAETVAVPNRNYHVFKFNATFDIAPKATVIVYRFKDNEIVATKTELTINDDLNNFVKLKLSTPEAQPGKDINIDVITKPESYVGLVGVDQSVLLLKNNEDLSKEQAFRELEYYQHSKHYTGNGPWSVEPHNYINDYFRPFQQSGTILFTNAKKDEYRYQLVNRVVYYDEPLIQEDAIDIRFQAMPAVSSYQHQYEAVSYSQTAPVEPPRVRTEFPETWLWEDIDVNNPNGTVTLTRKVPDTITSWVISAFSVNGANGLGLTKNPKTLNVFQPFFVSLNLPYSVKRGEVVAVPVVLFNYLNTDLTAAVVLDNENGDFEFVDDVEGDHSTRERTVSVESNSGVSSTFLVRFTSVGQIPLKVTATSAVAGDAVVRILQVDPEGIPQFINKAVFVDLREVDKFDAVQNVDVPENAVPGSLKINVNAIGDLLGGAIQNLHQLIRLPTGCGEQNMLNFVPNIVVLDYLKAAGNLDPAIKDKAIKYLLSGYQRELTYRHNNGSFSAFGKSDRKGSTWLTAFVVKSFKQAEDYIDVDSKVIDEALEFLSDVQAADGSFPEFGYVLSKAMQGGSSKGVALTAYTAIAFLKNKKSKDWKYQETVNRAIINIVSNIEYINDPYSRAIVAYALQLADHPMKDEVLDNLVDKSMNKDQHKWWTTSKPDERQSKSLDVEVTSYGLLALVHAKRSAEALPYFRWLLAQRNERGGFFGTQDTVVGLESLATYSRFLKSKDNDVHLKIHAGTIEDRVLEVNDENGLVFQSVDLPSNTSSVQLSASGHGFALFQLSYRYNLKNSDIYSTFTLKPKVLETTRGHLNVEVCSRFNPKSEDEKHSNMVIVEVTMPSGFLIEKDRLDDLLRKPHVKLVETKSGETVADIYFDQMPPNEEICLNVQGYRSHKVAENKPVPVRIYDYYDSSRSAREFYEIPFITSCNICEGDECSKSCKKELNLSK